MSESVAVPLDPAAKPRVLYLLVTVLPLTMLRAPVPA